MKIMVWNKSLWFPERFAKKCKQALSPRNGFGLDKLEPLAYLKHETEEMTFGKRKKKTFLFLQTSKFTSELSIDVVVIHAFCIVAI